MSVRNFSSLAGLEVTEKSDLIYFLGWVGGRVAGESGIKANLSLSLSWSWVELRLSLAKTKLHQTQCREYGTLYLKRIGFDLGVISLVANYTKTFQKCWTILYHFIWCIKRKFFLCIYDTYFSSFNCLSDLIWNIQFNKRFISISNQNWGILIRCNVLVCLTKSWHGFQRSIARATASYFPLD